MRENVFNIVGPLDGAAVLDLYAGSGAMGLEALSRGAARAVFVERDRDAVRTIERNLDKLRPRGNGPAPGRRDGPRRRGGRGEEVRSRAGRSALRHVPRRSAKLARYLPSVLSDDGVVVVETDARVEPELPLPQRTTRKYGQARITVFEAPA